MSRLIRGIKDDDIVLIMEALNRTRMELWLRLVEAGIVEVACEGVIVCGNTLRRPRYLAVRPASPISSLNRRLVVDFRAVAVVGTASLAHPSLVWPRRRQRIFFAIQTSSSYYADRTLA